MLSNTHLNVKDNFYLIHIFKFLFPTSRPNKLFIISHINGKLKKKEKN